MRGGALGAAGASMLAAAAAALWLVVALQARSGSAHLSVVAAAVAVTACLAAWPFAMGWRPFASRFVACPACRTVLRAAELPNGLCPACMAKPA